MAVKVTMSGPLFEGDTNAAVRAGVREGLAVVAKFGQQLVQDQLYPGHGYRTGNLHDSVNGELIEWNHAVVGTPVIYSIYVEDGHHRFKGYHMFAQAGDVLVETDFSDDIATHIVERLT
jgi:hypothetical protein